MQEVQCPRCLRWFRSKVELGEHVREDHPSVFTGGIHVSDLENARRAAAAKARSLRRLHENPSAEGDGDG